MKNWRATLSRPPNKNILFLLKQRFMKQIIIISLLLLSTQIFAQIPTGYYDGTTGLDGGALKAKLRTIISANYHSVGYDGLYDVYETSDNYTNGKVWDMYSMKADGTANYWFTHHSDKCGAYANEGDCYNREHTIPQSWGLNSTQKADAFIVIPSDGKVNGMRSSLPYGETGSSKNTSSNGSKTGSCSYSGYSGTIFEPIDRFKGDIARGYFYAATRYNVSSLSGASFSGDGFSTWTKNMLLEWAANDPVSQKEIDRNDAIYSHQNNRNPYIDHPEWVECVFGANCSGLNFTSSPVTSAMVSVNYSYNISYNVEAETETITCTTKPSWLTFTPNTGSNTAILSGTPTSSNIGNHNIVLTLNEAGESKTQEFTIIVSEWNSEVTIFNKDFNDNSLTSGGWTSQSISGAGQIWYTTTHTGYTDGYYVKMSGYDSGAGTNNTNEDWFISPSINFDDYTDESLSFVTAMKQYGTDNTFSVFILENYDGTSNPNTATLNDITSLVTLSSGDYNFTASGDIDVSGYDGVVYLAFKYTSGTSDGRTWEVEDIIMTANAIASVNDISLKVSIFPNPATQIVNISFENKIKEINLYNVVGKTCISNVGINNNNYKLDIKSLTKGIYFIEVKDVNNNKILNKLIKE